jgi:dihydrofolate reductase
VAARRRGLRREVQLDAQVRRLLHPRELPEWNNTTVLRGDVVQEVAQLKERHDRDVVVHGSPQLAQTLIEHDLVDALHLMVYPVVVGAGKRLFAGTSGAKRLQLVRTKTFGDGVHLLVYERAA